MARFHPLEVTDVQKETRDAVVVTLRPREEDRQAFDFVQGQYLTFRKHFDGEELRRSYSICAGKDEGVLKVGIKRVDGGAFSTWANEDLKRGAVIEAMPPMGKFHTPLDPAAERHYLGFAGGSGITPLLSIIKTVLAREPGSRFTLIYANRQITSIMFREELEDLKNLYLGRFSVLHVLETEAQEIDLFTGRIDEAKMKGLFKTWIDPASVDTAFICGPEPMMLTIAASLRAHGLDDSQIKFELFASGQPGRAKQKAVSRHAVEAGAATEATVTLDGATRSFNMPKQGQSLLEAALDNNLDAPYACKAGVCSTCRAKVLEGEVDMQVNHALEDYEVRQGYVLSCQCYPLTDKVVVTYDE
ncbi:ring-1,2-phenylacetyl-CoA epoxidase subunit PaaE [Roseibium hamelinense]|uniref:Ring-1,2-phenylacetyl-CoA epoxidase subunit PaaE n=1 Tax=Roseibium hamelinense TaxID=150831 RepID=A0A562TH47_9HYPH|nr:1,2-phenylacetyl-CoA epoxidase subunit PaaE [Roseibium hamelinense]MTI45881.1 phenylacetate-CoA oxygenase/reductase subunit PaaK [Roseibium hamelinense]TWI92935.1 ring-1,2-phenylacetyl-CoA epoxidase subunit PaaE [Roseibium hamelinense]